MRIGRVARETRRGSGCRWIRAAPLVALCLFALSARGEDRYTTQPSPGFPQPEKGRALVYLLRPIWVLGTLPPLELYDERDVFGYLPVRGYIAVQLEPGERVFPVAESPATAGGAGEGGLELFLAAGRTYVLRLDERREPDGRLVSQWAEMALADLPAFVAGKSLRYVTLTADGRAALEKARAARSAAGRKKKP